MAKSMLGKARTGAQKAATKRWQAAGAAKRKKGVNMTKLGAAIDRIESRIRKSDPRAISTRKLIHKSARLESLLTSGRHGGAKYARQRISRDVMGALAALAAMKRR